MKRAIVLTSSVLLASLVLVTAVRAITFGEPDNGRHPFVGALVGEAQGVSFPVCSGTLVSANHFVTAAHCLAGLEEFGITNLRVTFAETIDANLDGLVDAGVPLHPGTGHFPSDFGLPGSKAPDVGVFVLSGSGVSMPAYGQLPAEGFLDGVDKKSARFTTVGYGAVRSDKTKGPHSLGLGPGRMMTTQSMQALVTDWVTFSMNPSTGNGGTCFGDSGGPHFLGAGAGETRTIV
jgi:Trypsin